MTLTKQKLLLEILYTLYVATKTSRIPRKAKRIFLGGNFLFRISEYTQRERKCSLRKQQIFISQTTDFHFANYRFSFRKLQILISQTTDFHFANYRFSFPFPFRFVPFRFANYSKPFTSSFLGIYPYLSNYHFHCCDDNTTANSAFKLLLSNLNRSRLAGIKQLT